MAISTEAGGERPLSDINVVPLTDVMLVLLIVFLIAIPVSLQTIEKLKIPGMVSTESKEKVENLLLTVSSTDAAGRSAGEPGFEGASREGQIVYDRPLGSRFSWGLSPGLKEIIGGPDGFILYQLTANANANWAFSRSTWLTGTVSADLLNNFDKFRYDAPSNLPRVRTDIRHYVTTSDVTIPNLQLTSVHALGRDLYGMAYAGLLEEMYGGVGGELLYRPLGQPWALGFDANWVKQRDYDQRFSFRDYEVATGHATLYYAFGRSRRVNVAASAGRYLAGDWGVTLDVSRVFANGAVMDGPEFMRARIASLKAQANQKTSSRAKKRP